MTNEEKLWQALYELLNNAFAAAGFMGNIFAGGQESLCHFPNGKWIKNGYFGSY